MSLREIKKITFVGDIMCEKELIHMASRKHNFDFLFKNTKAFFEESDFVAGNLETPIAGRTQKYSDSFFSFNAPDSFADSLSRSGITFVSTANNHCLDRGVAGLVNTLEVLDDKCVAHTGTFHSNEQRASYYRADIDGLTVGIIAYTYGTNLDANNQILETGNEQMVNLLRPQNQSDYSHKRRNWKGRLFDALLSEDNKIKILKRLHKSYYSPLIDNGIDHSGEERYIEQLISDIREARDNCDAVIFCPHMGGQFNEVPGNYSKHIAVIAAENGCDAVIASHPHVVQEYQCIDDMPCFFSLGNYSLSPETDYLLHDLMPEYGLAVHLYVGSSGIVNVSFSILKMVIEKNLLTVFPTSEYFDYLKDDIQKADLMNDIAFIYRRVTGQDLKNSESPQKEYFLK